MPRKGQTPAQRQGARIREVREAVGISAAELARRCGWTDQRQSHIETGYYGYMPKLHVLRSIATALGVSVAELLVD